VKAIEILEDLKLHMKQAIHKLEDKHDDVSEIDYLDFEGTINNAVDDIDRMIRKIENKEPRHDNSELENEYRKGVL
jgi:ribosome-associated translation inhibitor RaiA